jgi:PAS domain S-box-containing protein
MKSATPTLSTLGEAARQITESAEAKQRQQAEELAQAYRSLESQILERDRTAAELQKLSRVVEQSPTGVVITDASGRIEYVNPTFIRLTGYTAQEAIGKTPRILNSGQIPKETIKQLWETILSGQEWRGELLNKKKNGELYWEFTSISPITDAAGNITHFVAVKENITERKHAEAALRDSEVRHRALFDLSADAIMLLNRSGFIECNGAALRIFGLSSKAEFISLHPSELSPPTQPDGTDSHLAADQLIATALHEGSAKFEWMHRRTGGEDFPAEVWLTALDLGDERVIQATVRDISKRKQDERELADLNARLIDMSRRSGMAEVATNVLHNVGNVLNSVNVAAGVIQETIRASEVSSLNKAADMMEQHLGDLDTFVTQDNRGKHLPRFLIDVSRQMAAQEDTILEQVNSLIGSIAHIKQIVARQQSDAKGVSAIVEEVSLAELLEDALRMNAASMQRHTVEVIRQFDNIAPVMIDKQRVLQIVINLISNAKNACDESGKTLKQLTVSLRRSSEGRVLIEVQDNGVGIPTENLTRIFAHGFTTRKDGHGFGLHSAALAAEELDGSLTACSDGPGTGATFTLDLPYKAAGVSLCKS